MIKKIFLYGTAFGSLSASMVLINFFNQLYMQRTFLSAVPVLGNVVILGLGVYLFIKSIMVLPMKKPLSLGKTLIGSLSMALISALFNIGAYQHVQFNRTEVFQHYRDASVKNMETKINKEDLSPEKKKETILEHTKSIEENIHWGMWARVEIYMFLYRFGNDFVGVYCQSEESINAKSIKLFIYRLLRRHFYWDFLDFISHSLDFFKIHKNVFYR